MFAIEAVFLYFCCPLESDAVDVERDVERRVRTRLGVLGLMCVNENAQHAARLYERYAELGAYVRNELRRLGLDPLARDECACPVVTTFAPPGLESSASFVARCRMWGYAIGGQSGYLAEKRMVQIATMGAMTRDMVSPLFGHIDRWAKFVERVLERGGARLSVSLEGDGNE